MNGDLEKALEKIDKVTKSGNYAEALKFLGELIGELPCEDRLFKKRAYVLERKEDYKNALKDISSAIKIDPKNTDYYFTRGRYLLMVSDYRGAVFDFTEVINLCDYNQSDYYRETAYFMRAEGYLKLKMYDQVRNDCKHVRDDFSIWVNSLRTKNDILGECNLLSNS